MRAAIVVAIGVLCGCGSKRDDKPAGEHPSSAAASATPSATTPTPKAKLPPLTAQQLAEYKRFVKAGWAAQKQSKWRDAVTAFEGALTAIPFDQRAETELGLSAMQAGDLDKAKRADDIAVSQAVDHKVEAMARFNYGALLEKTGDTAGALKQYTASVALRPNATVQAAADRLEKGGNAPLMVVCEAGATPCDCAIADAFTVEMPEHPTCTEATAPIPGWHVYHVEGGWLQYDYLFDDAKRFVAIVGDDNDRGRHTESTKLDKAEIKTTGGHRVVWLYTSSQEYEQSASTENDDEILDHHDDTQTLTLCVLGATNACPLAVPIDHEVTDDVYAGSPDPKPLHPPLSSKAIVTVADDGTATVAATGGKPDDELRPLLGPHKLW
jgi:tetratricopeptide (TPR) repeat protein